MARMIVMVAIMTAIAWTMFKITGESLICCLAMMYALAQLTLTLWQMRDKDEAVKDDILDRLEHGPMSFIEIRDSLESISHSRLSSLLQNMKTSGEIRVTKGYFHLPGNTDAIGTDSLYE